MSAGWTVIWDFLFGPFAEFAFMRRALVACCALALGSAPIGVVLMLRRMSLFGEAMSHAILPGAAIGFLVKNHTVAAYNNLLISRNVFSVFWTRCTTLRRRHT